MGCGLHCTLHTPVCMCEQPCMELRHGQAAEPYNPAVEVSALAAGAGRIDKGRHQC
jgi:hypothetical protein